MGLYIKGMRMPESCGTCFVGNRTICKNGCPLVALPEKHGRLIDADALVAKSLMDGAYGYVDTKEIYDALTIVEAEDGT